MPKNTSFYIAPLVSDTIKGGVEHLSPRNYKQALSHKKQRSATKQKQKAYSPTKKQSDETMIMEYDSQSQIGQKF